MKTLKLVACAMAGIFILIACLTPAGSMLFHLNGCFDDKIPGKYSLEKKGNTYELILDETYEGSLKINGKTMGEFTWEVDDISEQLFLHVHLSLLKHLRELNPYYDYYREEPPRHSSEYAWYGGISLPVCYFGINKRLDVGADVYASFYAE